MRRPEFRRRLARLEVDDNSDLLVVRLNQPGVDLALRPRLVLLVVLAAGHRAVWGCPLWSRLLARLAGAAVASGSEERLFRLRRPPRLPSARTVVRARPKWQVPSTKCSRIISVRGVPPPPRRPRERSSNARNAAFHLEPARPRTHDFCGVALHWCRPRAAFRRSPRCVRSPLTRSCASSSKKPAFRGCPGAAVGCGQAAEKMELRRT